MAETGQSENIQIDHGEINEAYQRGDALKSEYNARDAMYEAIEQMYHMHWQAKISDPVLQKTVNPDPHNAVEGAVRLLTSTEPVWKVRRMGQDNEDISAQLENAAQQMWTQSTRQRRKAPQRDMVRSALLYDEIHVAINSMHEWAKRLQGSEMSKQRKRVEDAARRTPFSITVWNPKDGYPLFDALGLAAYYREVKLPLKDALAEYGPEVMKLMEEGKDANDLVTMATWYDLDKYIVWIDGICVWAEEWALPFLPIDVTVVDGSSLFDNSEDARNPLLKATWKSGMWENLNITGTAMYTDIKKYGLGPMYAHQEGPTEGEVELDWERGIVKVPFGHNFGPLDRGHLFSPEVREGLMMAEQKIEQSTLYRTAFGQNIGSTAAFSTVALLSQSGRLPLVGTKEQTGEAIASIMEKALRWYREIGEDCEALGLKPSEVPEDFELTVTLEIDLPQDKLQSANTAQMLVNNGLASKEWVQEELLHITDPAGTKKQIWKEKAAEFQYEMMMQQMAEAQKAQQQQQQMAMMGQGGGPQGMPQGGPMPQGGDMRGMPMNPQGGAAMQGGLPQAQGGMIPQMGPGDLSEEQMPSENNPIRGRRIA